MQLLIQARLAGSGSPPGGPSVAWRGGPPQGRSQAVAPLRGRRKGAPILDPAHPAKPGELAAGTEKRHAAEPRNDRRRSMRTASSARSYAEDGGTRRAPLSKSGLPWMRPHEQAQRKASYPDSTRRMNAGSRPARPAKRAAARRSKSVSPYSSMTMLWDRPERWGPSAASSGGLLIDFDRSLARRPEHAPARPRQAQDRTPSSAAMAHPGVHHPWQVPPPVSTLASAGHRRAQNPPVGKIRFRPAAVSGRVRRERPLDPQNRNSNGDTTVRTSLLPRPGICSIFVRNP